MAKGQKKSNREIRKPKQPAKAAPVPVSGYSTSGFKSSAPVKPQKG